MRKLHLLLFSLAFPFLSFAQAGQINQINIVSFTIKPSLPSNPESWASLPGSLIMVAQKVPGTVPPKEPRLVIQIKNNGAVVCGNNIATARVIDPFDVKTFTAVELTGILSNCRELKEGNYTICVQFFNIDRIPISREVCKDFRIEPASSQEYSPPTLITPENDKKFSAIQLQGPVTFRWTPVAPKPREAIIYRLKVWQLMQGQNGAAAIRSNQPLINKDVEGGITQTTVTSLIAGPCKPPYLCDFIWNVQALTKDGKPFGNNNGLSENFRFSAIDETSNCPTNEWPANAQQLKQEDVNQGIRFRWKHSLGNAQTNPMYRLKVWQLMQNESQSDAIKRPPMHSKEAKNRTETTLEQLMAGPCKPPYLCDFIWIVELTDANGRVICSSEATTFSLTSTTSQTINCPELITPESKKKFTQREAKGAVTFRWKENNSNEPTNYKLQVWQLMQGQKTEEAISKNKPIITRQISKNNEVTINNLLAAGPCKPPYLCDFIWRVDVTDAAGNTLCSSQPATYSIASNDIDIQIDSVNIECCNNGKQNVYIKIKNNLATPVKITQIKIDKVNGSTASIVPSPLAPALAFTISGNGTQAFTGQINCIDTAKIIRFFVAAEDPVDNAITETEVEADTLHCRCDACDEKHFSINVPLPGQITTTSNSISFNQAITIVAIPPKTVKTIKAELVYFEMVPENIQCLPCNKDPKLYGHFTNGTNSQQWNGNQSNLNIAITTPVTPCCNTLFRWCIRYIVEFSDCTICSKVICYQQKKSGCNPTSIDYENNYENLPK